VATLLRVVGYLSIPVLLISVGMTVRSIRREQAVTVTVRSAMLPMIIVSVMLWIYLVLLGVTSSAAATWLPFAAGIAFGLWWTTRTTRLTVSDGRVLGAKTAWVLLPWAISMSLTQGLALTESSLTVPVGFTVLFAVSGLVIGENVAVLQRRARLLGGNPAAPAVAALLLAFVVIGMPGVAHAADLSFQKIANGGEPSVTVEVSGSGQGYYGDSISTFFRNDTGRTITIEVETGLQLVPRDATAQTMITVGQTIEIPPGGSTVLLQAFCGEMHDRAPGAGDTFDVRDRIDDTELLRVLEEMRRTGLGGTYDSQQLVWHFSDDNDVSSNSAAQEILRASRTRPIRDDADRSAGAIAVFNGAIAIGLTRTDGRRLLTGAGALKHLTLRGAGTVTIPVIGEDGITRDKLFVLPPEERPHDAAAIAFTTKDMTDPATGETVTVIDDTRQVEVLRKPLLPPPADKADAEPLPPEEKPAEPAGPKKIADDEVKRIVTWGVKNNRTPADIQRDVDARNETLGGSGTVSLPDPPKRITLPQGEVTLAAAEHTEYLKRAENMADRLDNARIVRGTFEGLQTKMRRWSAADKAVIVRWILGTKQIYDQALLMNDPGPWMARSGGFGTVDEMLEVGYGRPTWTSYDTRKFGSHTEAVEAWKRQPGGSWSKFQEERARVMQQARDKLRKMIPRTTAAPEPPAATVKEAIGRIPTRVFVGPNVDVPVELLPSTSPAANDLSWYNRPAHEMSQLLKAQQHGQEYLRVTNQQLQRFMEYERGLAARIGTPGNP